MTALMPEEDVDPFFQYVVQEWTAADTDCSGSLDIREINALLNRLNLKVKKTVAKQKFQEVNVNVEAPGELNFTEFLAFLQMLRDRPEMNEVFVMYSNGDDSMTAPQFQRFMKDEHKEDVSLDYCRDLIRRFERYQDDSDAPVLYINGFRDFLTSVDNDFFNPKFEQVYQDMTQPLTHYWTASSHNTYCTGDQLKDNSSVEQYKICLLMGCRCIELDIWDGPDNEPLIYHGHTLTSRIKFRDVILCIEGYGFVASPYPIILSLENHCSPQQQIVMANIMDEVFGEKMLPDAFTSMELIPSPEALKGKILLKGKGVKKQQSDGGGGDDDEESGLSEDEDDNPELTRTHSIEELERLSKSAQDPADGEEEFKTSSRFAFWKGKKEVPAAPPESKAKQRWSRALSVSRTSAEFQAAGQVHASKRKSQNLKAIKEVSNIAMELSLKIHFRTTRFETFQLCLENSAPWEMSSFSETKLSKILQKEGRDFVQYNYRQMSRIYPKGTRFDSSNYDPQPAWVCGCQMVALNYQTNDKPMWMNIAKFRDNGNCGYNLKPDYMRVPHPTFDPSMRAAPRVKITVEVVSAWQLPKVNRNDDEVIDPYVVVNVHGLNHDTQRFKTTNIQNNGFNPVWHEEFTFTVSHPELALLTLEVYDYEAFSKDVFIGHNGAPLHCIRNGYRHVPIFGADNKMLPQGALFCRFRIETSDNIIHR